MKARYIKTIFVRDKFNPYKTKVYEYRGKTYTLDFDMTNNYLGIEISASGGHKYEQQRIDDELDNPRPTSIATSDAEEGFKLFWKYCEEE